MYPSGGKPSPDVGYYGAQIEKLNVWFSRGYLYIGYFFILEEYRMLGLGTRWLKELETKKINSKFFLTVDDFDLTRFYIQSKFRLHEQILLDDRFEWLLIKDQF